MRAWRASSGLAAALLAFAAAGPGPARAADLTPACPGLAPAAGEAYSAFARRAQRQRCRKPWTILVYMAADNDLLPYALWDLYEMEAGFRSGRAAAGSTARADLLVQLEAPGREDARRIHVFEQASMVYDDRLTLEDFSRRTIQDIRSPVAAAVAREENGSAVPAEAELERFVEWGIEQYPSEHYMVIVWGHGQGWAPARPGSAAQPDAKSAFASRRFGGLAFSDSEHTFLDIPSLRRALARAEARLLDGRPIDVYASDACLMQMVEVAYEISGVARFVAGSSQVENYLGLPYRRMMFELNTGRFSGERARPGVAGTAKALDEPYLLAAMLPRIFKMSLESHGLHGRALPDALATATMSSLSSRELSGELVPSLGELGRRISDYLTEAPLRAIALEQVLRTAPSFMGGTQELGGFLTLLRQSVRESTPAAQALLGAIDATDRALSRAVIAYALGTRYTTGDGEPATPGFRGLALWLPESRDDFSARIADFASSLFYRDLGTSWRGWLGTLFRD